MIAHTDGTSPAPAIVAMEVAASRILDLRDPVAVAAAGVDLEDAVAPWQDIVAAGGVPTSWAVRDQFVEWSANGLIDPSRTCPGLWHLVLFRWNEPDAPTEPCGFQAVLLHRHSDPGRRSPGCEPRPDVDLLQVASRALGPSRCPRVGEMPAASRPDAAL